MDQEVSGQFNGISLKVRNLKCFGDEEQGFEDILPVNILVGRNNSGKSTLIDAIEYAITPADISKLGHNGDTIPEIIITQPLKEEELRRVFRDSVSGGPLPGNHWDFGSKLIGLRTKLRIEYNNQLSFLDIVTDEGSYRDKCQRFTGELSSIITRATVGKIFKRLRSERDIKPETDNWPLEIRFNGDGATNAIQSFFTNSTLPTNLVEEVLLDALNQVYRPDSSFSRMLPQRIAPSGSAPWEVYLIEDFSKVPIALSQTGSGFKTILLALVYLYLIPTINNVNVQNYVFAFEELENNLHPAVQRRLLLYLRDFALKNGCTLFITTHSNVVIDLFSRDEYSQIIHITRDENRTITRRVKPILTTEEYWMIWTSGQVTYFRRILLYGLKGLLTGST
ncbi:MAG TPA: ATP-binding protein [Dehalococcoidia bacterium]|nr:ATP-binding protein [Dehalococcoidia bacterium]